MNEDQDKKRPDPQEVARCAFRPPCARTERSPWVPVSLCNHQLEVLCKLIEDATDPSNTMYGCVPEEVLYVLDYIATAAIDIELRLMPEVREPGDDALFDESRVARIMDRQPCPKESRDEQGV